MKTIEVEEPVKRAWCVGYCSRRGDTRVYCERAFPESWYLRHESDIPEDWPEEVKQACLDEILPNRELAKDEMRFGARGWIRQMRWESGKKQYRVHNSSHWTDLTPGSVLEVASREWFEKNRPLADNETVSITGRRGTMSIEGRPWRYDEPRLVITWSDGQKSEHSWGDCLCQGGDWARRRAYYNKHAVEATADNEFVDENGRKWVFEMRDDGMVQAIHSGLDEPLVSMAGISDWSRAALAYRDKERARWAFEFEECGNVAVTKPDGDHGGFWLAGRNGASCELTYAPTWVREKARKLWEEHQKKAEERECLIDDNGKVVLFGYRPGSRVRVTIEEVE